MPPKTATEYSKEKMEELSANLMETAKRNLHRDGYLCEIAFLMGGQGGDAIVALDYDDSDGAKEQVYANFQMLLSLKRPAVLARVMDTWIRDLKVKDGRPTGRVRDMPGCRDAISIMVSRRDGIGHMRTAVYIKRGKRFVFGKEQCRAFERGDIQSSIKF